MNFFYNKFGYGIKECIIKFVTKTTSKKLSDGGTNNDKLQVVLLQMKVVDLIGLYYVDVIQNIPYDKHKPNNMWGQTSQIYKIQSYLYIYGVGEFATNQENYFKNFVVYTWYLRFKNKLLAKWFDQVETKMLAWTNPCIWKISIF